MADRDPLVIVGGGPAGLSAARAYRDAGGAGDVLMLTDDDRPPYRRPPLSKGLLRGETPEGDLPLEDPGWYPAHGVAVRCGAHVAAIDLEARTVTVGDERIGWSRLLLATGSEPVRPPLPGADLPGVHVLRTVPDSLELRAAAGEGARALVVGSGFIGCEAAVSLAMRGARVTMATPEPSPQDARLGPEVGERLAGWLAGQGVTLHAADQVEGLERRGAAVAATLADRVVEADLVLLATGARPRVALADDAGLPVERGAVLTDAAMRAAPGVWCAGDLALADNPSAGRRLRVEHWGEALAQGAVAGRAMAGAEAAWDAVPGFWSTIGDRTIKQAAWGDGWDQTEVRDGPGGSWTAWYGRAGRVAGVLTHDRDDDYGRGAELIRSGALWPPP